MKKIMNDPTNIVNEMLLGMKVAHGDLVDLDLDNKIIYRKDLPEGKVGVISGGGSGHEPSHAGFVGDGMLSAAISGAVFTSPAPNQVLEAIKIADQGAGVFMVVKNYSGDVMNFEMAKELAEMEGITCEMVIVDDDVAVEDSLYTQGRRGVAGTVLVHKIVGHLAREGKSISEIKEYADELVKNIKTVGIALSGVTTPEGGKESFELAEDEIEYGVGIHGEPGYRTEKLRPSKELAKELLDKILSEFEISEEDTFGVLINGMGSTPLMEEYVFLNDVQNLLDEKGIKVNYYKVGDYMTALDMEGLSLTLIKLDDISLEALNSPVRTIAW